MKIDYKDWYNADYFTGRKTYCAGNTEAVYHGPNLLWEGFETIASILQHILPKHENGTPTTVLDVGCSAGDLCARLLKRGFDAWGIDVSEYAITNAAPGMEKRLAVADAVENPQLPAHFPATQFDAVIATDFLEHIYNCDLSRTFDWLLAQTRKTLFFCVATCHDPQRPESFSAPTEFVAEKGQPIPKGFEGTAVSGHVNVRSWPFWARFFTNRGLQIRWDLMWVFQMLREATPSFRETWGWSIPNVWVLHK